MQDNRIYVWDEESKSVRILIKDFTYETNVSKKCYVVDTHYDDRHPLSKYGTYEFNEDHYVNGSWSHVPFGKFPKDFKLALLLLGVT